MILRYILAFLCFVTAGFIGWLYREPQNTLAASLPPPPPVVPPLPQPEVLPLPSPQEEKAPLPEKEGPYEEVITLQQGDTLAGVLSNLGISDSESQSAIEALSKVYSPRDLKSGEEINVIYDDGEKDTYTLQTLSLRPTIAFEIMVQRTDDGKFVAEKLKKDLVYQEKKVEGDISISLYADAQKAGAPPKVIHEMVRAYSYDVDFQRDFHPGDSFRLVYDEETDQENELEEPGELLYAELTLSGKTLKIFKFTPAGGTTQFYNEKGESIKKALLKTPIDGARLSSPFGNRRHPVLGYTKMHRGVDFAAPVGTPIMAAGDGVVERASAYGAYGNYVKVRHTSEFATAYAHLSRYAKGVKPGKKVKQGQIIGYVGRTGRTTGPHLHFEVIKGGLQINPKKVTQLPGSKLNKKDMNAFMSFKKKMVDFAP